MASTIHERVFGALASLSLRHPRQLLILTGILIVAAGALIPTLSVSTSRYGLVADDEPHQARMYRFFDRFGTPDAPAMVISGGTPEQRQAVVRELTDELDELPELHGRLMGRTGPADAAEVLLLQRPDVLAQAAGQLPPGIDVKATVEGGLPAWVGALAAQLSAGLDGEAVASPEQMAQAFDGMAGIAATFETVIDGGDPLADLEIGDQIDRQDLDSKGYLVTADGKNHVITMFPALATDDTKALRPLIEGIRARRDEVLKDAPEGIEARLTGLPALTVDEDDLLKISLLMTSGASALGIMLLCLILFRSLRQTILALMPLFGGTVLSLGVVKLLYGGLNLITASFISVLLGLGIDFSVHVLSRINEERRSGAGVGESIRRAVVYTGPGILSAALITAVAFLTTTTTEFTAYSQLGVITAIGLAVIVAATLIAFPALLSQTTKAAATVSPEAPGVAYLPGFIRRLRLPLIVLGIVAGVGGAIALPHIRFASRTFDFMPTDTESVAALDILEHDPTMSPMYANLSAEGVEEARAMTAKLRALDSVAGVQTATDMLPPLTDERLADLRKGLALLGSGDGAIDFDALAARKTTPSDLIPKVGEVVDLLDEVRFAAAQGGQPTEGIDKAIAAFKSLKARLEAAKDDDAAKARLAAIEGQVADLLKRAVTTAKAVAERGHYAPEDLPELLRRRFVSKDGEALAIYAVPAGDFWQASVAERFTADVEAVDPEASGLAINTHLHELMIISGFRRAAGIAAGLILLLLIIDFRGIRNAALALVPTLIGWLWMIAVMALVDLPFNVSNIVCLPLVLGVGTAFGVHLMHRAEESGRDNGGVAKLDDLLRGTGSAVIISALTTMVGFGALILGRHGAMFSLGLTMVIGIGTCLLASILILPALLHLLKRAR
ncbi:MAG: MMPL family transporter [Myxococcales bacterium]|nr:MMPL family transporter [Myxococcales bacterium]